MQSGLPVPFWVWGLEFQVLGSGFCVHTRIYYSILQYKIIYTKTKDHILWSTLWFLVSKGLGLRAVGLGPLNPKPYSFGALGPPISQPLMAALKLMISGDNPRVQGLEAKSAAGGFWA